MKSISIRVEDELAEKLERFADMQHRTKSYIINKAIKDYVAYEEHIIEKINAGLKDIAEGRTYPAEKAKQIIATRVLARKKQK